MTSHPRSPSKLPAYGPATWPLTSMQTVPSSAPEIMRGSNPEPQEIHLSQSKKVFQRLAELTTRVPSYLKRVSSFRLRYGCLREKRASSENVARARHAAA